MLLARTKNECVTVADLLKDLGNISPARIHLYPLPGIVSSTNTFVAGRGSHGSSIPVNATSASTPRRISIVSLPKTKASMAATYCRS